MDLFMFFPILIVGMLFIGLPWLLFHYITKWKTTGRLSNADEQLLDELHEMARKLDDRLSTIERIMTAENPNWRQQSLSESHPLDTDLRRSRITEE